MAGLQDLIRRFDAGGPTVTSQADFQKQWDMLKGQTDPTAVAQRQALASALGNYQTNQNIQNLFNQGQTGSTYFSNPPPIQKYPTDSSQTGSTGFPTTPPPISPLRDMRGGFDNDMLYGPQGTFTSEGTPILTSVTPPPPKSPMVDTRNMLRDDVRYAPQGPYTSEGTPILTSVIPPSPLASMSAMQKPQGMIQGQAMSPDIQANFPTANTTYDPNKPINEQIKALTSTSASGTPTVKTDAASLKNTYGIDNPALVNYIASTTGLTDSDLKNLKTVYNAKPTQQIAVAQQANDPLHVIANAMVSHDATVKERLTDPKSYIYNQGNVPVYKPASQSTNAVGDIFTTKNSGILNQEIDRNGYLHVTAGGNQYLINPNSNRIISSTPITHGDPNPPIWSSGASGSGIAGMAKGGSVRMPQEYSQGNWKLI